MRMFKKTVSLLLAVSMLICLAACAGFGGTETQKLRIFCTDDNTITIAKLVGDHTAEYEAAYGTEEQAIEAISSGEADFTVCSLSSAVRLCSDSGAKILCAAAHKKYYVLADKASGITDLAGCAGKTLTVPADGDSQRVAEYVFANSEIKDVKFKAEPGGEKALKNKATGGAVILPEPYASILEENNPAFTRVADLGEKWSSISNTGSTPVTCCVVISADLAANNPSAANTFKLQYEVSLNYLFASGATYAVEDLVNSGVFKEAEKAKSSLSGSGLKYVSDKEMEFAVAATLEALTKDGTYNGVKIPGAEIFY